MRHLRLSLFTIILSASSCVAIPSGDQLLEDTTRAPLAAHDALAAPVIDWPSDEWWRRYNDPQLDALIHEAIANSPSLAEAAARVRRSEAAGDIVDAAQKPQIMLSGGLAETKASYWNGAPYVGVPKGMNTSASLRASVEWNVDFFGKNRSAITAALSETAASHAEAAQAELMLTTSVASAYAELLGQFREADVATQAVRLRELSAALVARRKEHGLETLATQAQAESALATARQALALSQEQRDITRFKLAALLGAGPDRALAVTRPADPVLTGFGLPTNLPADLLGRRPDIRAARYRAEAQAFRVREARAGFYPSINLAAVIGPQVLGLGHFFDAQSLTGAAGPAINLPIFRGGALKGNLRGARAGYDEAVASYDGALVHALHEVAEISTSQRALAEQLRAARLARSAADTAYQISLVRYRGGLLNYINVLTAENSLLAARQSVAQLETRQYRLDIALIRALGGGL